MKILSLIAAIALTAQLNFETPLSIRLENYVDKVEQNCKDWTKEQWKVSLQEYYAMVEEYKKERDEMSDDEKYNVNKAIGRYNAILVKYGVSETGSALKKLGERIPAYVDGFVGALKSE